jgi:hypothetical protein
MAMRSALAAAWPRASSALRLARCPTAPRLARAVAGVPTHALSARRNVTTSGSAPHLARSGGPETAAVVDVTNAGVGLSRVRWDDGHSAVFVNAWLRDHCRCPECLNQVCVCVCGRVASLATFEHGVPQPGVCVRTCSEFRYIRTWSAAACVHA